jgi:cell division protein FtsN
MPPRETELYKDKVEVSLDGRQIFYLFFGGAVVVGIVFVLGVLVGRRVEARGHIDRARTHAAADPLAALDRLEGNGQLSFRASLTAGKEQPTDVEKEIERRAAAKAVAKPDDKKSEEKKADDKKTEEKVAKSEEKKAEEKKPEEKKPEERVTKSEEKKSEEKKSEDKKSEEKVAKADSKSDSKSEAKSDSKSEDKKSDESKESKTRYTLQLSSFQDKGEAEAFLSSVKAQGFTAQIKQAEVEGKGTFYRVRMGTYTSLDAAIDARAEFEKSAKKSASIMKL